MRDDRATEYIDTSRLAVAEIDRHGPPSGLPSARDRGHQSRRLAQRDIARIGAKIEIHVGVRQDVVAS